MQRSHEMPYGAEVTEGGVKFSFWAPSAREVSLILEDEKLPMTSEEGWYRLLVPHGKPGQRYAFQVEDDLVVPDPASRFQPDDVHKKSLVVDPRSFEWSDQDWSGRPWEEAVIYEAHVGTVTPEGTYASLMEKLPALAELGITAIELMPLADFSGKRNWGYDGVLLFAPDASYGTPNDLKQLINEAHKIGLMVFIDVVYNHFGPTGNYLHAYAKPFFTERHQTPWGAGLNFDGTSSRPVRDFFIHNAMYWLTEFHADGLRFDAVHAVLDDSELHIITEIADHIRSMLPDRHVHLILENDANQAKWLDRDKQNLPRHYNAQWNDDLHHCWHTLLTGESDGYYSDYADQPVERLGRALAEGFAYQGEPSAHRNGERRGESSSHLPPSAFIGFLQNHDQIGNRAYGERLSALVPEEKLSLARAGLLLSPQIPMLYMGEEWSASSPFLYFVDFPDDPTLAQAVRDGRQKEFSSFNSFAEQATANPVPDPTAEDTYIKSQLIWDEIRKSPYKEVLRDTDHLLSLRRKHIVPLTKTAFKSANYKILGPNVLSIIWSFEGGRLRFTANFSASEAQIPLEDTDIIWKSPNTRILAGFVTLGSWSGLYIIER